MATKWPAGITVTRNYYPDEKRMIEALRIILMASVSTDKPASLNQNND